MGEGEDVKLIVCNELEVCEIVGIMVPAMEAEEDIDEETVGEVVLFGVIIEFDIVLHNTRAPLPSTSQDAAVLFGCDDQSTPDDMIETALQIVEFERRKQK